MKVMTEDTKYGFGQLVDFTHAEPVAVANNERPIIVVHVGSVQHRCTRFLFSANEPLARLFPEQRAVEACRPE